MKKRAATAGNEAPSAKKAAGSAATAPHSGGGVKKASATLVPVMPQTLSLPTLFPATPSGTVGGEPLESLKNAVTGGMEHITHLFSAHPSAADRKPGAGSFMNPPQSGPVEVDVTKPVENPAAMFPTQGNNALRSYRSAMDFEEPNVESTNGFAYNEYWLGSPEVPAYDGYLQTPIYLRFQRSLDRYGNPLWNKHLNGKLGVNETAAFERKLRWAFSNKRVLSKDFSGDVLFFNGFLNGDPYHVGHNHFALNRLAYYGVNARNVDTKGGLKSHADVAPDILQAIIDSINFDRPQRVYGIGHSKGYADLRVAISENFMKDFGLSANERQVISNNLRIGSFQGLNGFSPRLHDELTNWFSRGNTINWMKARTGDPHALFEMTYDGRIATREKFPINRAITAFTVGTWTDATQGYDPMNLEARRMEWLYSKWPVWPWIPGRLIDSRNDGRLPLGAQVEEYNPYAVIGPFDGYEIGFTHDLPWNPVFGEQHASFIESILQTLHEQ